MAIVRDDVLCQESVVSGRHTTAEGPFKSWSAGYTRTFIAAATHCSSIAKRKPPTAVQASTGITPCAPAKIPAGATSQSGGHQS